jgi:hypothetical protein
MYHRFLLEARPGIAHRSSSVYVLEPFLSPQTCNTFMHESHLSGLNFSNVSSAFESFDLVSREVMHDGWGIPYIDSTVSATEYRIHEDAI